MSVKSISLEHEYKKNTGTTPRDIQKLREWLNTQPHLPGEYITDLDLILIYHCCDRSALVSKQVLDLHYTLKTLFTNFFKDRAVDDKTEENLHRVLLQPLQTRSTLGDAVFYCRMLNYDPKNFEFSRCIRSVLMILDLWQYLEGTWHGLVLIFDLDRMKLGHLTRLDVQSLQQFIYYLQEAMLVKVKGLHFINAPSFMDRLMMMIKPFMKKELMDVLVIHQIGAKTLDKYVPMEGLPKEAGGEFKKFEECRVLMILDLWQYLEGTWHGLVLIFDLDRMKLGHLTRLDVQSLQQFIYYLQEAMLVKVKGLHFINAPSFMDRLMMMIKPFMKKELMDVLVIHQIGAKTLDKYVPMEGLPKEAGGEFKKFEECRDEMLARLRANKDFFVQENKKRVVESKRPGKPKIISDIFGSVEGSFKKLEID